MMIIESYVVAFIGDQSNICNTKICRTETIMKTNKFQNQFLVYYSNLSNHNAHMSYLIKNRKWMKIFAFKCAFLPSDRLHPTDLKYFLFWNFEENHSWPAAISGAIENKIYQNSWQTVLLTGKVILRKNTHLIFENFIK